MPSPSSPGEPTVPLAADLVELADGLRELHQALLDERRQEYERERGPIAGAGELLHLLAHDPYFAWLRYLSALMVDLDTLLEEEAAVRPDEAGALRAELEEMFSPAGPGELWARCAPLLQIPGVTMAYARVRSVLSRLPPVPPLDTAAQLHARHRWAVARRKRGVV